MSEQTGNKGEEKESLLVGFNGGNRMKQNYNLNEKRDGTRACMFYKITRPIPKDHVHCSAALCPFSLLSYSHSLWKKYVEKYVRSKREAMSYMITHSMMLYS